GAVHRRRFRLHRAHARAFANRSGFAGRSSERYRNARFDSRSSTTGGRNPESLRTFADIVSVLLLRSGPARLATGRNRRPEALRLRGVVARNVFAREPVAGLR